MRWSEKDTFQFVKLYLKYENLWNPEHEEYKMKDRREKSYREIMREFKELRGISLFEQEIKTKIKSLRSTYSQELGKIKQRSGPDYIYTPSIKWFAEMHKHLKHLSKIKLDDLIDNQNSEENDQILLSVDDYKVEDDDMEPYQPEDTILIVEKPNLTQQPESSSKVRKKIKRSRASNDCDSTHGYSTNSNNTMEDEFDIYGKYIASQLRCMDIRKALKLQIEIQTLVNEARINEIDEDNKYEYI